MVNDIKKDLKDANDIIYEMHSYIENDEVFPDELILEAKTIIYILDKWETPDKKYLNLLEKTIDLIQTELKVNNQRMELKEKLYKAYKEKESNKNAKLPIEQF